MRTKLIIFCFAFLNIYFLQAQELVFPPKVNFFQYSASVSQNTLYGFPNTRIWGWSDNGKVAYSIEREIDGRGGQTIDFVILDLVTDDVVYELKMDSYEQMDSYHNEVRDEALYIVYTYPILNALRTHNIIEQRSEFLSFPFRKNNTMYDSHITGVEYGEDGYGGAFFDRVVTKYAVQLTADDKRKVIANFAPVDTLTGYIYVCGYLLSPYENRALVIVAEEHRGHEGNELTYRFSGCHLGVGFN